MRHAINVLFSIPLACLIFFLTEKFIFKLTENDAYADKIQKSFIVGFVLGLLFIIFALTIFNEESNMNNKALKYALYGAGAFLILNSVFFNWDDLDEGTKIIILATMALGIIIYTYSENKE